MITILFGRTAAGKDYVLNYMLENNNQNKNLFKLVNYTTRKPRKDEKDGVDYNFITKEAFEELVNKGFFLETTSYYIPSEGTVFYGCPIQNFIDIIDIASEVNYKILQKMHKKDDINYSFNNIQEFIENNELFIENDAVSNNYITILNPLGIENLLKWIDNFKNNYLISGISYADIIRSYISIIYVDSDFDTRYKRYIERNGSITDFLQREKADNEDFDRFFTKYSHEIDYNVKN